MEVLSIEQMIYLINLGLDTSDASIYWETSPTETGYYDYQGYHETDIQDEAELVFNKETDDNDIVYIPTYTLQDIIDKLPKSIYEYELVVKKYEVRYQLKSKHVSMIKFNIEYNNLNTILDCAYEMFKWCIENNYIEIKK